MTLNYKIMKNINLHLPAFLIALLVFVGCKSDKYVFEDLGEPVKSFYTNTVGELLINENITFTNESENADTYLWDFGDGTTSTEKNPTKIYTEGGIYTVKLKAVGTTGTGNYAKSLIIVDPDAVIPTDKFIYYIEYGGAAPAIKKVSLNLGSTPELVVSIAGKGGVGLAVDTVNGKIYYTDFEDDSTPNGKVWRMNLDGTNFETIVSGITDPYSIAVNVAAGKIYWADDDGNISRANLDGSGLERQFISVSGGGMRAIAFNSKTNKIYFYDVSNDELLVANADGTGQEVLIAGVYGYGIFVDEVNSKLYFQDSYEDALMQSNLDGTGIVKIADATDRAYGIGVDYITKKIYWSNRNGGSINRSNLDGTKVELNFLSDLNRPAGFFIK